MAGGPSKWSPRFDPDVVRGASGAGQRERPTTASAPEKCSTTDVDEDRDGSAACTGQHRWAKRYGSDDLGQIGNAVAAGAQGNVIVVGRVAGPSERRGP
ncbi:hypothetical protein WME91_07880 [Sorangium sp. So ce269]